MFRQNNMQDPVRALRVDISFVQFIITTAQNRLKMVSWIVCLECIIVSDVMNSQGVVQGPTSDFNFDYCVELGRIFLNILVVEDSDSSFINHQPKRVKYYRHFYLSCVLLTWLHFRVTLCLDVSLTA